jgi:hypothetical protein
MAGISETIADHQHPDIKHIKYIGGPFKDKFLTKQEKKDGQRAKFYVDTIAIHDGKEKVVKTEFKKLFTANAFVKALRENPEVTVEQIQESTEADILLQGRSPADYRRDKELAELMMVKKLKEAVSDNKHQEVFMEILNHYLRDVTVIHRHKTDKIPTYTNLK